MRITQLGAAAVALLVSAIPAAAGELEEALAAVNATLPGRWSGVSETENLQSGEVVSTPIEVSYTVASYDGLDYAYWNQYGLSLARYLGNGRYRIEQWPFEGEPSVIEYQVVSASPPDAEGNWIVDEMIFWPAEDGVVAPWPQTWSMRDGELSVTREPPTAEDDVPNETWWRGTKARRAAAE